MMKGTVKGQGSLTYYPYPYPQAPLPITLKCYPYPCYCLDVNAQGGHYGNALYAAIVAHHEAIAKMLIEKGADVNAQEEEYRNILQTALCMAIIQLQSC